MTWAEKVRVHDARRASSSASGVARTALDSRASRRCLLQEHPETLKVVKVEHDKVPELVEKYKVRCCQQ
jgi:hypothetical protein